MENENREAGRTRSSSSSGREGGWGTVGRLASYTTETEGGNGADGDRGPCPPELQRRVLPITCFIDIVDMDAMTRGGGFSYVVGGRRFWAREVQGAWPVYQCALKGSRDGMEEQ